MRRSVGHRRSREAGFTVIELMVALTAGLIVVMTIYYLSASATHHFHEQQRIAQTQTSVRMALEQLRRDVSRAGYGGTPDTDRESLCFNPSSAIQAVEFIAGGDTTELQNEDENLVVADRLRLVGNYAAPDSFLASGLDAQGDTIYLQRDWQAFRRNFNDPLDPEVFDEDAFNRVFVVGRMLQIQAVTGQRFFVEIDGLDATTASIDFTPTLPIGSACVPGLLEGAIVSPLSRIEWITTDLLGDSGSTIAAPADADSLGLTSPQLVRQEIQFGVAGLVVPVLNSNQRVVLEHVANVQYGFVFDQSAVGNNPPTLERITDGSDAEDILDTEPSRVRSIIASISAHTPEQNPRFPWIARVAGDPLTRFRVNPLLPGAARVRTATAELLVTNVAYRNLP